MILQKGLVAVIGLMIFGTLACDGKSKSTAAAPANALKSDSEISQAALDAEAAEEELSRSRKPASRANSNESVYIVQVGTFRVESNAKKVLEQLKAAGLPAIQKRIERDQNTVLYAVRFEPTPSKTEAEKFVESAQSVTGQKAMVMSLGK